METLPALTQLSTRRQLAQSTAWHLTELDVHWIDYPGEAGEVSHTLLTLRRNTAVRLSVTLIWLQFGHKVDKKLET